MLNELIEKIAAETGLPAATVAPVVGALLSHLGDVLPAPIAHHIAVALGVHQDGDAPDASGAAADPAAASPLGGPASGLLGSGSAADGGFPGAVALVNVAASLMSGFLSGRR